MENRMTDGIRRSSLYALMRILHFAIKILTFCSFLLVSWIPAQAQSSWNEALKRSLFAGDDLSKLESGQILGKRNTIDQLAGVMSVQNVFLVPKPPAHVAGVILGWNPTRYPELGIMLHESISQPVTPQSFRRLVLDANKATVKALIDNSASQKESGGPLNLSKAESAKLASASSGPNSQALAWQEILLNRTANFQATGIAQALPYENSGSKISLQAEIQKLVREIPGITQNFAGLLGVTFNNPNAEKQASSYYWEMLQVQRQATLLLAGMFQVADPATGKIQVSDFQYYVSNSFSASLILYDLIPVMSQGQPATLVWRSDFVFIPSAVAGSGMERMATENILLLEVQKSIKRLQKDAS